MQNDKKDVGFLQDFIFYLQNAIACEHHCIESYAISGDKLYLEIAYKIRKERSKWMYRYIKESKNQKYCISKHLMACAQAMKELGNRYIETKEKNLSEECFKDSVDCESIFILINEEEDKKGFFSSFRHKESEKELNNEEVNMVGVKGKSGRPIGSKNKPKEKEPEEVELDEEQED